jgi:hypothetical protein
MQLTMTLAHDVSEREVAFVVRQGLKHKNVRLIGMLPAFYSGRHELAPDARCRLRSPAVVHGIVDGFFGRVAASDFHPIPCSHPNCGWVTLFAMIGPLGYFRWYFNSPVNHRLHHSNVAEHQDINLAAVLTVWDREFSAYR